MFIHTFRRYVMLLAFLALLLPPGPATAQVEIEADPFAYSLSGFSLHIAHIFDQTRLSVGTFGLDIPQVFHGNEGWSSSMRGAGLKWDYLGASPDGLFAGLDGGYMRSTYRLDSASGRERRDVIGVGIRAGYRLPIGERGLYLVPWLSLSYNFDGDDVAIGDAAFDRSPVTPFATMHVGWTF